MRTFLSQDAVWENVGIGTARGPDEAIAVVDAFSTSLSFEYISVEMLHVATQGDAVLTERIDHFHKPDGEIISSLRMMGIFTVVGDKITGWRDYFDTVPFAR
jgi:limonene-1,2-epoxide hydrolase